MEEFVDVYNKRDLKMNRFIVGPSTTTEEEVEEEEQTKMKGDAEKAGSGKKWLLMNAHLHRGYLSSLRAKAFATNKRD